jgi:hypothetical protein
MWPPSQGQIASYAAEIYSHLTSPTRQYPPLPPVSAFAAIGNFWQENFCAPQTLGVHDHGSDGIAQWRLDRLDGPEGLLNWCSQNNFDPWSLAGQCAFFKWECATKYPKLWQWLVLGQKPLETLTLDITDIYERPSAEGRVPDRRIEFAQRAQTLLGMPIPPTLPIPTPIPPTVPPTPVPTMPPIDPAAIAAILQLLVPLVEAGFSALIKNLPVLLNHLDPQRFPTPAQSNLPIDPAVLAQLIEQVLAKLQQKA